MTIDVADLRKRAERTFPQVYPSELTELLDAYEELHRYDADMEAGGDWLPLHLREAVAGIDPEQRAVVTEWYWRTNLLIGGLQTERDRLRAALERLRKRMAEPQQPIIQWDAGTWIAYIDAALEGRE